MAWQGPETGEAVPNNNAEYNKIPTKFDNNKGAVGITTAVHGVANANVAKASSSGRFRTPSQTTASYGTLPPGWAL